MSPLPTNTISHPTHPDHKLKQVASNTPYRCDGCKVHGNGSHFNCPICSFDLHNFCATCPTTLTSNMNHAHPMCLVTFKPEPNQTECYCHNCEHLIEGLAYVCRDCNFWVHPLCVRQKLSNGQDRDGPSSSTSATKRVFEQLVGLLGPVVVRVVKIWIDEMFDLDDD